MSIIAGTCLLLALPLLSRKVRRQLVIWARKLRVPRIARGDNTKGGYRPGKIVLWVLGTRPELNPADPIQAAHRENFESTADQPLRDEKRQLERELSHHTDANVLRAALIGLGTAEGAASVDLLAQLGVAPNHRILLAALLTFSVFILAKLAASQAHNTGKAPKWYPIVVTGAGLLALAVLAVRVQAAMQEGENAVGVAARGVIMLAISIGAALAFEYVSGLYREVAPRVKEIRRLNRQIAEIEARRAVGKGYFVLLGRAQERYDQDEADVEGRYELYNPNPHPVGVIPILAPVVGIPGANTTIVNNIAVPNPYRKADGNNDGDWQ